MVVVPIDIRVGITGEVKVGVSMNYTTPVYTQCAVVSAKVEIDPRIFEAGGVVVKLITISFFKLDSYGPSVTFEPGNITTLSGPDVLTSVFVGVLPVAK